MNRAQSDPAIPWFRQPLVWLVIGIPLSSVIMGGVLLTLSVTSYDGLVADDYYKRGLQINRVLDRDAAAVDAGLEGRLQADARGTRFSLGDVPAGVVGTQPLTARFSYSTRAGLDREVTLYPVTATEFEGPGVSLADGRWYVEVGTSRWRLTGHLDAPGEGRVGLRARP